MICILLNKEDVAGVLLSRLLRKAGRTDIQLITAEELVYAPSFNCGFRNGKAFFNLRLAGGLEFSSDTVTAVINRIQQLPCEHITRFAAADQAYVKSELDAVFVFLFAIMPNSIFNKSTTAGFCGRYRADAEWQLLAGGSGFATTEMLYHQRQLHTGATAGTALKSMLYFNGQCYGADAKQFPTAAQCCKRLGEQSGEQLLEIEFWMEQDTAFFAAASLQPTAKNFDPDFINAINSVL